MKNSIFKRTISLFMAALLAFSGLATTAFAAGERTEIYMVSFPRGTDANLSGWERDDLSFMNGWHMDAYDIPGISTISSGVTVKMRMGEYPAWAKMRNNRCSNRSRFIVKHSFPFGNGYGHGSDGD